MLGYTTRRAGSALGVAVGVTLATFLLLHLEPGDPARLVLGEHATNAQVLALRTQWGLNQSLARQLVHFLGNLVHGNLGTSYFYGVSALSLIGSRIWITLSLVGVAALFAVVITLPLATIAAARKDRLVDHLVRAISVAGLGLPSFWFGIVLIELLALRVRLLPVGGFGNSFGAHLESLLLPGFTASLAIVPILVRSLRLGMIDVLGADFVATARSKGLGEVRVLVWHVARNALIPTVTLLGVNIAYLVGSTVVVERVFDLNGLGSLLLDAITNRDFPIVQATTLVMAMIVVLVNLLTDLLTARLDPRIRLT
jgi:peptide/nickel transport system permease protein